VGVTDLNEVPKRVCNQSNGSSYDQHRGKPSSHVNQRLPRPGAASATGDRLGPVGVAPAVPPTVRLTGCRLEVGVRTGPRSRNAAMSVV
jgi:hypothetical protein